MIKIKYLNYQFSDLIRHPSFVIFPYSVHSYGTTEIYALNIPTFVPSLKFFYQHRELIFDVGGRIGLLKAKTFEEYKEWLQYADVFYWKHFIYFDNYTHLFDIINSMKYPEDFIQISKKMEAYNAYKINLNKQILYKYFQEIQNLPIVSLPHFSYNETIQKIFNDSHINYKAANL